MRWRRRQPERWVVAHGLPLSEPWLRITAPTFEEAVSAARSIEWGFQAPDGREQGLSWEIEPTDEETARLGQWLDVLLALDARVREEQGQGNGFRLQIARGASTSPSGKTEALPAELTIRRLRRA